MSPTEFFAQQVKRYRAKQQWTQPQLAEKCRAAGLDWDRSIVANVEGNRRSSITLNEVFTLAFVLHVPPALLLFPIGFDEPIELVKGMPMQPGLALRWFLGQDDLRSDTDRDFDHEARPLLLFIELIRVYAETQDERRNANGQAFVHGADSQQAADARGRYAAAVSRLERTLSRLDDLQVLLPPLERGLIEDAERFGTPFPKSVPVAPEEDDDGQR